MIICSASTFSANAVMAEENDTVIEATVNLGNENELQPMATSGCENDYHHIFDNPQHNLTPFFEQLWRKSSGCIWCCIVSWTVLCDSGVYKRCNKCL